eukprot:1658714-Rhodomonas_salina.2
MMRRTVAASPPQPAARRERPHPPSKGAHAQQTSHALSCRRVTVWGSGRTSGGASRGALRCEGEEQGCGGGTDRLRSLQVRKAATLQVRRAATLEVRRAAALRVERSLRARWRWRLRGTRTDPTSR